MAHNFMGGEARKEIVAEPEADADAELVSINDWLVDDLLCVCFEQLDAKTLMVVVPQVCHQWRNACQLMVNVHLDLSWLTLATPSPRFMDPPHALQNREVRARTLTDTRTSTSSRMSRAYYYASPKRTAMTARQVTARTTSGCLEAGSATAAEDRDDSNAARGAALSERRRLTAAVRDLDFGGYDLNDSDSEMQEIFGNGDEEEAELPWVGKSAGLRWRSHRRNAGNIDRFRTRNIRNPLVYLWGRQKENNSIASILAGWRETPFFLSRQAEAEADADAESSGWKSGLCELFPTASAVTMNIAPRTENARYDWSSGWMGHYNHNTLRVEGATDPDAIILADKCPGITQVNFKNCDKLTDTAVIAFAEKCSGLIHADFSGCSNLTDAAVVALAEKCPRLIHASFARCSNLTDAAVVALAAKCRRLTHVNFNGCTLLVNGPVALLESCPGIVHADFDTCWSLSEAAAVALAGTCPGLPPSTVEVLESGCNIRDVELVMQQAKVSQGSAILALKKNAFDLVDAILDLTM